MKKEIELLSPAGDLECIDAALYFGADAVYVGGRIMQLRAASAAMTDEALNEAVRRVHEKGRKIYVTVNCFADNGDIDLVGAYAKELYDINVDAVIVSDIGVLAEVKKHAPDLEVHISTQANCQNFMAARVYYDLGAKRIVLARELSIEDIAELRARTPKELELEAFVHGAMCMAYSGRCIISSFLTGRSGNKGECAQPCRWQYSLVEKKRPEQSFDIEEEGEYTAILSSHDLCAIEFLDKLTEAGVSSFKIEGRMKTPYYVATVTDSYRKAIDRTYPINGLREQLDCISHRPYSSGFYFGEMKKNHYNDGEYRRTCDFAGVVLEDTNSEGLTLVEQRNYFKKGDTLELLSPHSLNVKLNVNEIIDSEGTSRETAHLVKERVLVNLGAELKKGDILRRRL